MNEEWSPEGEIIGVLRKGEKDIVGRLKLATPREFELDSLSIQLLSAMCTLDDDLLLVDSEANEILLLNKNFELEQHIKQIQNESFNHPLSICSDKRGETFYLIDHNNNRVLLIDSNMKVIKKVLMNDNHTNISIGNPIDISFYVDCLFVCFR